MEASLEQETDEERDFGDSDDGSDTRLRKKSETSCNKKDLSLIVKKLRLENRRLHHSFASMQQSTTSQKSTIENLMTERDALRRKVRFINLIKFAR